MIYISKRCKKIIAEYKDLRVVEGLAERFIVKPASGHHESDVAISSKVCGIVLADGQKILAGAVVLCTGTFLRGSIHIGDWVQVAGRRGDRASVRLAESLASLGLPLARMKTGTPPRLDRRSIDWDCLEIQNGDDDPAPFSAMTSSITVPQIPCHIAYTNKKSHQIVTDNLHRSALYGGKIFGAGPRYCPSFEDKVVRFADKSRHQVFLEPEGLNLQTIYPNGLSNSLPLDIQKKFLQAMDGLQSVKITAPGYAVEYDYVDPTTLAPTLAVRKVEGLFLAGQINGTTGYEEAGMQGLIAGTNAALWSGNSEQELVLDRGQAYAGVMVDDLTVRGVREPYRMLTSRAEYRLLLRADNADQRLTDLGVALGLVGQERAHVWQKRQQALKEGHKLLNSLIASPQRYGEAGIGVRSDGRYRSAFDMLAVPGVQRQQLQVLWPQIQYIKPDIWEHLASDSLYAGYVKRQQADLNTYRKEEKLRLPENLDVSKIGGLSTEIVQLLEQWRPQTLGAASRIPGVTPAALVALLRHVKPNRRKTENPKVRSA